MSDLTSSILTARTQSEVEALVAAAAAAGINDSRLIGNADSNAGPIEGSSAPHSALIERATNGIDAVLELHARLAGYERIDDWPQPPAGPREAAQILLKLPKRGTEDLTDIERRRLAENLLIMLEESGIKDSPTVIIEDRGIGQSIFEMPNGLLSLNRGNKAQKPWQSGAYGQGGSATLRFCPYTIFVSRKAPTLLGQGEEDKVAWTVAYRDEGDPYKDALPVYRYLVGDGGQVPSFDPSQLPDPEWHGTRVVHVAYELSRYAKGFTQLQKSIWVLFNSYLFDPVLPFLIGGRRQIDLDAVNKGTKAARKMSERALDPGDPSRPIGGNRYRLDHISEKNIEVPWQNSVIRDLSAAYGKEIGELKINYWVLRRPADSSSATEPAESYVGADSAVTVTLNGQRHDAQSRTWLANRLELPYLKRNLIVQIDIDGILPPAKRELFVSTRERMVELAMRDLIYQEAVQALNEDEELRRLNDEMRDRAMSKGAKEVGEKIRRKLARFIDTYIKEQSETVTVPDKGDPRPSPRPKPPGPKPPPRPTDDSHLPNVPTDIKFDREPVKIVQGRRTTVWLFADAKNEYLERQEDDLTIRFSDDLEGKVRLLGRSQLLGGKSLWTLVAQEDAPLHGGEIEVLLITPNGLLRATAAIEVRAPKKDSERRQREEKEPPKGPNIRWVERDEWDAEFTEKTVGEVAFGQDDTDIRVNRHHPLLVRALNDKRLSKERIDASAEQYLFAIACGLFRLAYSERMAESPREGEQIAAEQERMAEVALIAIDDRIVDFED
jgi:hypothetical protein